MIFTEEGTVMFRYSSSPIEDIKILSKIKKDNKLIANKTKQKIDFLFINDITLLTSISVYYNFINMF